MSSGAIRRFGASVAIAVPVVLLSLCGLLVPRSASAQAWFDTNWQYRRAVSVANPGGTPLTDYQVRLTLDASFNFARASSDGSDLRVTASDGTTQLTYWLETWNPAGSTAAVWVRVPSVPPAGTTLYLYYGNPTAINASNGAGTFDFFDDFESPSADLGYYGLSSPGSTILVQDQPWENSAPHTLDVVEWDHDGYRYWGYYGLESYPTGGPVGLCRSNDLAHWVKYTPGPVIDVPNARWPSVMMVGSTLHIFYTDYTAGNSSIVRTSSSDGYTFPGTPVTVVPSEPGHYNGSPDLFRDPVSGLYYLYWVRITGSFEEIMARSATTLEGLDSAPTVQVISSPGTLAAPDMMYRDGTYFLTVEVFPSGVWETDCWTSTASPTSGFTRLAASPILSDGSACFSQHIFGNTLYCYYARQIGGTWSMEFRSADLSAGRQASLKPDAAKWTPSGGSWDVRSTTQQGGSVGNVCQGSTSAFQILSGNYSGTDYVFEGYGRQISGNEWGLATRVTGPLNYVSANAYWMLDRLYMYDWTGNTNPTVFAGPGGVNLDLGNWYKMTLKAHGASIDAYVNDALIASGTSGAHPSGGVALFGEVGYVAQWNDVRVRKYAASEPAGTVASEQQLSYTLTTGTAPPAGGAVTASPPGGTYNAGTVVQLTAMPAAGYQFANWSGDATGTSNPVDVTMTGNLNVIANFSPVVASNIVSAGSASGCITPAHACATVPVVIGRTDATPLLGFSVSFKLSSNLALCGVGTAVTEGPYLGAGGRPTSFQVIDHGNGAYTADGTILGLENCGATSSSGTLFEIHVTHGAGSGSGTIDVTGVTLRNCSNMNVAATIGNSGVVAIDPAPVSVAAIATPQTVHELSTLTITPSATLSSCATGPVTWSIAPPLPGGATFDATSGVITWTPACGTVGSNGPFTLTATTSSGDAGSSNAFAITVTHNAGAVAVAVGGSFSVEETSALVMTAPTATLGGCAAGPVTWSVAPDLPTGAALGADGSVAWTPACGQAGAYGPFTLTALAATGETGTGAFNLTVTHKTGTVTVAALVDPTVAELSPLTVAPSATLTGCAGGAVTWTATGLPATAAIDGATGVVTWTPDCAAFETNGGVYGPVTVTAHAGTGETGATAFTIHVTNTPVAVGQVAGLVAATGPAPGGGAGRTGITVHFTAPPEATAIEVYRAAFGNYPEYGAPPNPGSEPTAPTYPPPAPWTLTSVTASGQVDNPPSRDFWYYVAFARNACGDVSPVSARTAGTLDYRLGDVSNGVTLGTGDNVVNTADMTALGAHYGLAGSAVEAFSFLDVGPTSTSWIDGRPLTDDEINFEDLVIFAINYGQVSFLRAGPKPDSKQVSGAGEIALARPEHVSAGTTSVAELRARGNGALVAVSVALSWDPAVVEPVGQVAGEWLTGQGGVALSPCPGTVDVAVLGGTGMSGEGLLSTVTFRVLTSGNPEIRIRAVDGRDELNRKVAVSSTEESLALVLPTVTQLSPVMPNPFTAGTTIAFSLARGGPVDLAIYTVTGRRVATLLRGTRDPGVYQLPWSGRDDAGRAMGAGVYYVHLAAPEGRFTRAITRLR